jgi:hypothetical protein
MDRAFSRERPVTDTQQTWSAMSHPLSLRSVLSLSCTLTAVALLGASAAAGCGSAGATIDDVGSEPDASAGTSRDAGREPEVDGAAPDKLDGAAADLDANARKDGPKTLPDGALVTYVSLGTAASFVVLSGETITNTGFTIINGNVGLYPGSGITGFPPGVVNGVVHDTDAVAAKAKQDLNDAYADASKRSGAPIPLSGDLGGMTLTPGLYVSATSIELTSGDLTLDALGDEDAIWVFQIGTTFVSNVGRKVLLVGNAREDNVFWNVGTSATIGVGSVMVGNFLTQTSISVQTGASMEGRFLTQTGSVTFDSNKVNRPKPVH